MLPILRVTLSEPAMWFKTLFYGSARKSGPGWMIIWPSGFLPYVATGPWMFGERKTV